MGRDVAILPEPDSALGKLNPRQQLFVRAYVAHGQRNAGKAYVEAGYNCKNANVARVNACVLLHRSDVQAALQEVCRRDLVALGPVANRVAQEILENGGIDPGVRTRLLMGVWDRTGLGATTEQKITVQHIGNDPRAIAEIRTMIEKLQLTPEQAEAFFGRTVAGKAAVVIDVEHEEIEREPGETITVGGDLDTSPPDPDEEPEGMEDVRW